MDDCRASRFNPDFLTYFCRAVAGGELPHSQGANARVCEESDDSVLPESLAFLVFVIGFDGDRFEFQVLVESITTARRIGDRLREIFATGLTLVDSETLYQFKPEVLTNGR